MTQWKDMDNQRETILLLKFTWVVGVEKIEYTQLQDLATTFQRKKDIYWKQSICSYCSW